MHPLDTGLVLHLLAQAQMAIHGHHFHAFVVPECFEYVRRIDPATHKITVRLVCGLIHVWQRGFTVSWR